MQPDLFTTLSQNSFTTYQLEQKIQTLRKVVESKLFNSALPVKANYLAEIQQLDLNQFSNLNYLQMFNLLEEEIKKIEPLIIYLPFSPSEVDIAQIGGWLRTNLRPNLFLDIKIDPSLIGGCALVSRGVYQDYSLKATIEERRQQVLDTLTEHLKAIKHQ